MPKKKAQPKVPKTRGPKGEGSKPTWDERRQRYRAKVVVGKYPSGGTRYVEVSAPTHAECVAKKKAVSPPDPNTVTVAEWAARWIAGITVASSTYAGYLKQIEARIVPQLGAVRLRDLAVSQVRAALVKWKEDGTPTANRTLRVGATMFADAVRDNLATANPFSLCPRLKYEPEPLDPFTPDELRAIIGSYRTFAASPLLSLLAAIGARVGEACALNVGDYDPATGLVSITKTYCVVHGERPPKSKHSRRTVRVPALARPVVAFAIGARKAGPLFVKRTGERYDPAELGRVFNPMLERLGIRRRKIHAMRHGVISAAVNASGARIANVARDAGDSLATIIRTYVHADQGEGICEAMDRLFSESPNSSHVQFVTKAPAKPLVASAETFPSP